MPKPIKIATLASAHGIRGEIKAFCYLENPGDLTRYNPLHDAKGKPYSLKITGRMKDQLIVSIDGTKDRNEAEMLKGLELFTTSDKLPDIDEGEFYQSELVGLRVVDDAHNEIGTITGIHDFGAGDVIAVKFASGGEELFVFDAKTFPTVDVGGGFVMLQKPEEF